MRTHTTAVSTATVTTSDGTVSGSTGATTAFKIKGYTATRTLGRLVPIKSDQWRRQVLQDGYSYKTFG
jgi:hypothetical protein